MNGNELALRPLRRFADFSGRSSRGELFYFFALIWVISLPLAALDLILPPHSSNWAGLGVFVLLACPLLAMFVRRLHDVGRSGWWILLLLPAMGLCVWNEVQRLLQPLVYPPPRFPLPHSVELLLAGLAFAIAILLLWEPNSEANRYGPNPRYGPVGESA